ncbi:MAG: mandelate racemase/muconate lactonizing enzyme family protein, partial [Halioglobus sp.]|nr:mandelate racemase/muconate lactonizing enzyme family protein [Halioglobus sp.]
WFVRIPLPDVFHPAWIPGFRQAENRFTLVRLLTSDGIEGYSAVQSMGPELAGLGGLLGSYLLGERADDIPSIRQRIREMGYLGWRVGWLEPACWDILGKAANKPIYELLGGAPGSIRLYASTGSTRSVSYRVDEVAARIDEGFDSVKLRVHGDTLQEDVEHIVETRRGVGDAVELGVDANQGWRVAVIADAPRWDLRRARDFCSAAGDANLAWVEEPLAMDAYDDLAALRRDSPVAISGGELNNQGLPEFAVMLEKGCFDIYQPDAVFTGGIAATWDIIRRVEAAGAVFSPHTWTNGIGFAINLQLFGAYPGRDRKRLEYPYDPPGWTPEGRDGLLVQPWRHERGQMQLPTTPGLGFEIDQRALRRHGRHLYTATAPRVALRTVRDRGLGEARKLGATRSARIAARNEAFEAELASGKSAVQIALGT